MILSKASWKAHPVADVRPARLIVARALVAIADQNPPPRRFIAGADAIATAEQKIADLKAQIEANRELSTSLAFDLRVRRDA